MDTNDLNLRENNNKSLATCNEENGTKPKSDLKVSDLSKSNRKKAENPTSHKEEDRIKTPLRDKDQNSKLKKKKRLQYHFKSSNENTGESQSKIPVSSSQSKGKTGNNRPHN